MRYERKFPIAHLTAEEVASILRSQPALFTEIHEERHVTSLYLDTLDGAAYAESVAGIAARRKVRIRTYGDPPAWDRPTLELKIKQGHVGHKQRYPLAPLDLSVGVGPCLDASDLPPLVYAEAAALRPVTLNTYRRRYYLSADGRLRATIDRDLSARRWDSGATLDDRRVVVLELKYAAEDDAVARDVIGRLPFRLGRNSKFVRARDALFG